MPTVRRLSFIGLEYAFAPHKAYGMSRGGGHRRQGGLVEVETDQGVRGIGEAFGNPYVTRLPPEARAGLGLARLFHVPLTFESMSVLDNATIGALLRHPKASDAWAKAREVLQRVGLGHVVDAPARSLGTPGRSVWRSPARSPWSPRSCCSTRRWPA